MLYGLHYENSQCLTTVQAEAVEMAAVTVTMSHNGAVIFHRHTDYFLCEICMRVCACISFSHLDGQCMRMGPRALSHSFLPHLEHISLSRPHVSNLFLYILWVRFCCWQFLFPLFLFPFSFNFFFLPFFHFFGWKREAEWQSEGNVWRVLERVYRCLWISLECVFGSGHLFRPYTIAPNRISVEKRHGSHQIGCWCYEHS